MAGAFAVILDGAELAAGQLGSRKSRMLLKLLAASRPALVTADRIAEVLWESEPPAGADRNIASLISRLRAVLGPDVIQGGRAGYRLGDGTSVSVDLDIAARLCEQAERKLAATPAVALAAAARACDLLAAGIAIADEPYASWPILRAMNCENSCAGAGSRRLRQRWRPASPLSRCAMRRQRQLPTASTRPRIAGTCPRRWQQASRPRP